MRISVDVLFRARYQANEIHEKCFKWKSCKGAFTKEPESFNIIRFLISSG